MSVRGSGITRDTLNPPVETPCEAPVITPKQAALTAIIEAISCLDFDSMGPVETDDLVEQALDLLMEAREMLTDRPWPDLPLPSDDRETFEAWITARTAEQQKDGRQ